jgi:hypothetical protein
MVLTLFLLGFAAFVFDLRFATPDGAPDRPAGCALGLVECLRTGRMLLSKR